MTGKEPPQTLSELAGELAIPIARYMTSRDPEFPGAQKGSRLFHHSAMGTFEAAYNALWVLGLLKNIPEDDPKRKYEFRGSSEIASVELAIAASEFPAHLKSVGAVSQEEFIEVFEAFVDVLESYAANDYYGHTGFHTRRLPFLMPDSLERLSKGLERFGFVRTTEQGLLWTDKCSRAMWLSVSWADAENTEIAWRTMPADLRAMIYPQRTVSLETFQSAFLDAWNSDHWGGGYFADWKCSVRPIEEMFQVLLDIADGRYGATIQLSFQNPGYPNPFTIFELTGLDEGDLEQLN